MNEEELLKKVDSILEMEGENKSKENKSHKQMLEEFILPGLYNSKNTLASLYKFVPKEKKGFIGKLKTQVLIKLKNVVLNVVERESMRQQKFNELSYQALQNIANQLEEINQKLSKK